MFLVSCGGNGGPIPPITSNKSPIASFTANPTSGVEPLEVYFNASSSYDSDGTIISYQWDFKDGNTGNGQTINHTFSSTGSYNVMLTVIDNEGATDSVTKTITAIEEEIIEKEQVHLYIILVETEEEAKDILEELKAGGDFIEIAKEKSIDPSAAQGGDLGYISRGQVIIEIENVAFALEIGNISDIIKTEYGFSILKVTDKKPEVLKTFEEVKEEIVKTLIGN